MPDYSNEVLLSGAKQLSNYLPGDVVANMTPKQLAAADELFHQGGGEGRKDNGLSQGDLDFIVNKANGYAGSVSSSSGQAISTGDNKVLTGRGSVDLAGLGLKSATASDAGSTSADSSASTVGYTGLAGANKGDSVAADRLSGYSMPTTRALVELSTGRKIDDWFYDKANPNYSANQIALTRANNAAYGDVGANLDARNWNAIMAAADPLKAAEEALKAMYSDKAYLAANTDHVLAQGYLPEQADYTYKQMSDRVGSTYDANWSKGTKYEGKYDTASYLNNVNTLQGDALAAYENNLWTKWGGNPRVTKSKGVVDAGTSTNSVFVPPTTTGQITGTSNTTPGSTSDVGSSTVTGGGPTGTSSVTPGSTGGSGLIANATTANSTASAAGQTAPTQLNNPTATGGAGLLTGANTLTPGTFSVPNTATGNVNSGGLISGVAQQLSTQNAQVGLPTGVTPKVGVMGNNTGGMSVAPYNPYAFTGANTATGNSQNWYNSKTGQRYTAPAGTWTPPSADWAKA